MNASLAPAIEAIQTKIDQLQIAKNILTGEMSTEAPHHVGRPKNTTTPKGTRKLSASARKRISEAQTARWAGIKGKGKTAAKTTAEPKRKEMSASARKKISEAKKAFWAKKAEEKKALAGGTAEKSTNGNETAIAS